MTDDELTDILCAAIRRSLDELRNAHPDEELSGFALCTDDDLSTVYPVGTTTEQCSRSGEDDVRYIPVDWEYGEGLAAFDAANAELARRASAAEDHVGHVEQTFECLVRALEQVKQTEPALSDDVLLIVTSTDPSPELEVLATKAVRRLNSDELFRGWSAAM